MRRAHPSCRICSTQLDAREGTNLAAPRRRLTGSSMAAVATVGHSGVGVAGWTGWTSGRLAAYGHYLLFAGHVDLSTRARRKLRTFFSGVAEPGSGVAEPGSSVA